MTNHMVLLKDLPDKVRHEALLSLLPFTIAFIRIDDAHPGQSASLLGSGTLVKVGNTHAILTADHVLDVLPQRGRLCIFLSKTDEPHTIDIGGIAPIRISGRGRRGPTGPDLAALVLAPSIASALETKKVFYNLTIRRAEVLNSSHDLRDGLWIVQGFLQERLVIKLDTDGRGKTTFFYNFSGIGVPDEIIQDGAYDYVDFPVSYESRSESPVSWGGMSGGGLWQIPLKLVDGEITPQKPILSGVVFYQHPTTETLCGVKTHGRRSVYGVAYDAIAGSDASARKSLA